MTRRNGRILAFQALFAWEVGNNAPEQLTGFSWKKENEHDDLTFSRLLLLGALEHIDDIDAVIRSHLIHWDFDRVNKVDLSILRLSVYTLLFQNDVHPTIVIDEAVDIAKQFSLDESYKFINAVLDNIRKAAVKESP
jgi:N utilization substance protein B